MSGGPRLLVQEVFVSVDQQDEFQWNLIDPGRPFFAVVKVRADPFVKSTFFFLRVLIQDMSSNSTEVYEKFGMLEETEEWAKPDHTFFFRASPAILGGVYRITALLMQNNEVLTFGESDPILVRPVTD